jgi:two-component system NtrC family sensor kinase
MRAQTRDLVLSSLLMVALIGAASALFIYRVVRVPVRRLIAGTERVARGDLDTRIDVGTRNQIGQLAESFNSMTADLRKAREELTAWSEKLERKVVEKTDELSHAQQQIVQMEKMASLGKLSATVAHELNNPLAGIVTYAKLVARSLGEAGFEPGERDEVARYLDLIQKESLRCGDIVRNLLVFARVSGGEFALQRLNPILERAVMLVRHHLEIKGIRLAFVPLGGDDQVVCDADQVQQALLALLVNAVEAMPQGGTLTLRGDGDEGTVRLVVSDTGVGIPPDALPHIFEPFFSTKEGGTGVGLGLSVVYGIAQRHGGRVEVDSAVGRGTTFTLHLPRNPGAKAPSPASGPGRRG